MLRVAIFSLCFVLVFLDGIRGFLGMYFMTANDLRRIYEKWRSVLESHVLPVDVPLIVGLIAVESSGRTEARSGAGAVGLMQVTQVVLDEYFNERDRRVLLSDLVDPDINVEIGYWYLNRLQRVYGLSLYDSLRAYNCGPTGAKKSASNSAEYANKVLAYGHLIQRFLT